MDSFAFASPSPATKGLHSTHEQVDSLFPDKIRRTLKTPAQIEALEKFYDEHKYPSEQMKLQFAKQIGLSEKQVSVWLCHRRSKDKSLLQGEVYVHRKQNISSAHASGLGQESCSSTKQMDKNFDHREVESKRSYGHNSSSIVLALEQSGQQINGRHCNAADDDTSGSSSTSHDRPPQHDGNNCFIERSRFSSQNGDYMLLGARDVNHRGDMFGPRYSCSDVLNGRTSISCIKRKLGGQYREDGPPLGFDFDPLPPGAFDSPLEDSNKLEHCLVGNFINRNSFGIPTSYGKLKVYDDNISGMLSSGLSKEDPSLKRKVKGSHPQSDLPFCELNHKMWYRSVENVANEMPVSNYWRGQKCSTQISKAGQRRGFSMCSQKPDTNMLDRNHCQNKYSSVVSSEEVLTGPKPMSQEHERIYFLDVDDITQCRQPFKKKKISKERIMRNGSSSFRCNMAYDMRLASKTKNSRNLWKHDGQEHSEKHSPAKERISRFGHGIASDFSEESDGVSTSSVE